MISVVLVCSMAWNSNSGMADMRPKAVVFMATEMDCDSNVDFWAGSARATAVNALIKPMMVPNRPSRVAMLARVAR